MGVTKSFVNFLARLSGSNSRKSTQKEITELNEWEKEERIRVMNEYNKFIKKHHGKTPLVRGTASYEDIIKGA